MRVGVTGASGYIGRALLERLALEGIEVVSLGRRAVAQSLPHRACDLREPVPSDLLAGLDAVVHLAANTGSAAELSAESEIEFARQLADAAQARGVRLLFASSQAASPAAPSEYGRSKARIEAIVLERGGIALRPGMVYGRGEAGLYGNLVALLRASPVLPALVLPSPRVQPVHVDDVAAAMHRLLVAGDARAEIVAVAGPAVSFTRFLRAIARLRLRRWRPAVPVPVFVLRPLLWLGARVVGPQMSPQRLDSLARLPPLDPADAQRRTGVVLRSLEDGLRRPGARRREILREADRIAKAVFARKPGLALRRRYARALARFDVTDALALPRWWPAALLSATDTPASRRAIAVGNLAWRIAVLSRLAEADPAFAPRFLAQPRALGALRALVAFAHSALLESRNRLLGIFVGRAR